MKKCESFSRRRFCRVISLALMVLMLVTSFPLAGFAADVSENSENDSIAQAQAISFGDTVNGSITEGGDEDYYALTLTASGKITITFNSFMEYYSIYLYNEDGNEIWKSEKNNWVSTTKQRKDTHEIYLEVGVYYIKVNGSWYNCTGEYNFNIGFKNANVNIDEPNNSIAEAKAISFDNVVNGCLAINDLEDYYIITLAASGKITIAFNSYMEYYSIYLYNGDGAEIWKREKNNWVSTTHQRKDTHEIYLEAGVYYIKVNGSWYNCTGEYNFNVSFKNANANIDEPNNSIAEAKEINFDSSVFGCIAINDPEDYYSVTLVSSGKITIAFNSYMEYYSIYLYNGDGAEIWKSEKNDWVSTTKQRKDTHEIYLEAGVYYIKVNGSRYNSTGEYNFNVSFTNGNATIEEPNNNIAEAKPISANSKIAGVIAVNDAEDYYRFEHTKNGTMYIAFNSHMQYYRVFIYDANGSEVWHSDAIEWISTTGKRGMVHELDLESGVYYVKVNGNKGSYNYNGFYNFYITYSNPERFVIDDSVAGEDVTKPIVDDPDANLPVDDDPSVDEPAVIMGDVDGDGFVTAVDARLTLRYAASLEKLTQEQLLAADVDGKSGVTAADARKILRVSAHLEASFQ